MFVNRVELVPSAHVQVRFAKVAYDGEGNPIFNGYHRSIVEPHETPGPELADYVQAINAWRTPGRLADYDAGVEHDDDIFRIDLSPVGPAVIRKTEKVFDDVGNPIGRRPVVGKDLRVPGDTPANDKISDLPLSARNVLTKFWTGPMRAKWAQQQAQERAQNP